mmetsp:Transcript_16995/g.59499  ORF Transcript_16995/g.59499 Transcript_16995/m.59499 type:complete len:152 (-) Transcript_16995:262-717(-)
MAAEGKSDGEAGSYLYRKVHPCVTPLWAALEEHVVPEEDAADFALEHFMADVCSPTSADDRIKAVGGLVRKPSMSYKPDEVAARYAPLFDGTYDKSHPYLEFLATLVNLVCEKEPADVDAWCINYLENGVTDTKIEKAEAPTLGMPPHMKK